MNNLDIDNRPIESRSIEELISELDNRNRQKLIEVRERLRSQIQEEIGRLLPEELRRADPPWLILEPYESLDEFLDIVAHQYGSNVSQTCARVIGERLTKNIPVDVSRVLSELRSATRAVDVALTPFRARFRST